MSNFISNNYKDNILCFSLNHHSKYVYIYLSNKILEILDINIQQYPENLDPQIIPVSCIIYDSVKNIINKNFEKNIYSQRQLLNVNLKKFLEFHYDKYSTIKEYLIENYS